MRDVLRSWIGAAVFSLLQLAASTAFAAQHCTDWMDLGDGTSWSQCYTNKTGWTCWLINNTLGSTAYQVKCAG